MTDPLTGDPANPDGRIARRLSLAPPLTGLAAPWSAEWASGHTSASPLSPWWRLEALARVAVTVTLTPEAQRGYGRWLRLIVAAHQAQHRGGGRG